MNNYTFKEAEYLVRFYFDMRNRQRLRNDVSPPENDVSLGGIISDVIAQLDEDSRRIIINEFEYNYPKQWWQEYYSKSSYYAIKGKAMKKFLAKMHR
ncbi:MAG: hypothetical protein IJL94_01995 [Erysipelotrichaceae bacterium]|nr:hypothetical protein [Erysipelotrichaceae bacterium]